MDGIGWLGLFVASIGVVMVLWGLNQRSKANALAAAARQWPTATATMIAAEVLRGGTARHPTFSPVVRYEFEAGGRRYQGDRLRPGYVKVGTRRAAERMLQPYPAGAAVPVRYDPANPESSLLELKTTSVTLLTAAVGALLVLIGGGIAVLAMAGIFSAENGRSSASASAAGGPGVSGTKTWRGSYSCGQGDTGLEVTLRPLGQGRLEGTLSFFPMPSNPNVPRGCYRVTGQADATTLGLELRGGQWVRRPPGFHAVDLRGQIGADNSFSGQVLAEACGQFHLQLVSSPAESCP